jgi:N-acetylglucosaminyldiphosphoundecaprenol N-acetyl-beta-D-mannosaminyltransferase
MTTTTKQPRIKLFGVEIDRVTMPQAVERLMSIIGSPQESCQFVVTPNVDHTVLLQKREDLRAAYEHAALVLADGHPVVWASRLLGKALPERVTGSDLTPALFDAADDHQPLRVFLLGAAEGVGDRAAANIRRKWKHVEVVGVYSPPLGFEHDEQENQSILAQIEAARPDILVVGLGAPKQELWVHAHAEQIAAPVALCVGATIDFLAGEKRRAPRWMQRSGTEWCYRMASEPKRLVRRYAFDAWVFPQLLWREWRGGRSGSC